MRRSYTYVSCPLCGHYVRLGTHTGTRGRKLDCRAEREKWEAHVNQIMDRQGVR